MTIEPPEPETPLEQIGVASLRAVVSAVPFAGGALVEIVDAVASHGRRERRDAFLEDVATALNGLIEREGRRFDDLASDPGFLNAIGVATAAAMQTADAVKLEALRNAVVNSTFQPDTLADRHTILLQQVATLTGTHLFVLRLYQNPQAWYEQTGTARPSIYMGSPAQVLNDAAPLLSADTTLIERVLSDLRNEKLADISLNTMMTEQGVYASRTSKLGDELLAFISTPPSASRAA